MSSRDRQALAIVEEALEIEDPAARAAMLDTACGDDAELRARVDQLLAFEDSDRTLVPGGTFAQPIGTLEDIPERFGPYKVVGEIARGGMGAVVKAVRDDGRFDQTVAIKLIRADLASQRARDRFAAERRILGRLNHPDIVRILDGGEAASRPWLAMDFIDGLPADEALDTLHGEAGGATQDERLEAFVRVGEAVAHAHRQLVVHADLKPSNVLIDRQGGVHLLDFGIARLIAGIDVDETGDSYPITRSYAAPERGQGTMPTVASDVFSLGVLLLVMLGQSVPAEDASFVHGTRLPQGLLSGDLAVIAARALAERPDDRYPDAVALAQDVARFLLHQPVSARHDGGWRYRTRLFVRRNCRSLLIGGIVAAVLLGVTGVAAVQHWRAETARAAEDVRFADARNAARYLLFDLIPSLEATPRSLEQRVAAAHEAEGHLLRLSTARQASDELRLEAAQGLLQLALLQGRAGRPNLGLPEEAETSLDRAEAIAIALPGHEAAHLIARIRIEQVRLATWQKADVAGARELAGEAEASVAAVADTDGSLQRDLLLVLTDLAGFEGRFAEQERLAEQVLAMIPQNATGRLQLDRWQALSFKAESLYYRGRIGLALAIYRQGLATVQAASRRTPADPFVTDRLARANWEVGTTLLELRSYPDAINRLAEAERLAERVAEHDPADLNARRHLGSMRATHAQGLGLSGRTDEALAVLRIHLATQRGYLANEGTPQAARDVAFASTLIGEVLAAGGRMAEACTADRAALAEYESLRRQGMLNPLDEVGNIRTLERRMTQSCG